MSPVFPNLTISTTMDFTADKVRRLYDYWLSKQGPNNAPGWQDIDLMQIYPLAPNIMVKEYIPDLQDWRNRFFGTGLTSVLGVEGTNKNLGDYHSEENAIKARAFFWTIKENKTPTRVEGQCIVKDREFRKLEGVYLPLFDTDGEVNMILCYEHYF